MKTRYKVLLPVLVMVSLATVGMGWLAIGVFIFSLLYVLFSSSFLWVKWIKKQGWISGALSFLGIFAFAILLRVFVLEIFSIPSSSMEATIQPGDHIMLSKLNYGPQLPRSPFEIPWINLFFFMNQEARAKAGTDWWEYRRWGGYSAINRNDIVVFKFPAEHNQPYIKRCIGLPGEEFQISDGQTFCDGQNIISPESLQHRYQLWASDQGKLRQLLDSMKIAPSKVFFSEGAIEVLLSGKEKDHIEKSKSIDSIRVKVLNPGEGYKPFPYDERYSWSIDNFGPVVIPAKGMKIILDAENFLLYKDILRDYENMPIAEKDGKYFVNGEEVKEHVFQQHYYFMLGDNRSDSKDSRFIGFVPEENVIGKAVCVLFSSGEDGFKWGRTLKLLD